MLIVCSKNAVTSLLYVLMSDVESSVGHFCVPAMYHGNDGDEQHRRVNGSGRFSWLQYVTKITQGYAGGNKRLKCKDRRWIHQAPESRDLHHSARQMQHMQTQLKVTASPCLMSLIVQPCSWITSSCHVFINGFDPGKGSATGHGVTTQRLCSSPWRSMSGSRQGIVLAATANIASAPLPAPSALGSKPAVHV